MLYELVTLSSLLFNEEVLDLLDHLKACLSKGRPKPHQKAYLQVCYVKLSLRNDLSVYKRRDLDHLRVWLLCSREVITHLLILPESKDHARFNRACRFLTVVINCQMDFAIKHIVKIALLVTLLVEDATAL